MKVPPSIRIAPFFSALFTALLVVAPGFVTAGTFCVAETASGTVAILEIRSVGTIGAFETAILTIRDPKGKEIFREEFSETGQFASTLHRGRALVVFSTIGENADVRLTFVGTDQDTDSLESLLSILQRPQRGKEPGNTFLISIYQDGERSDYAFEDIVCTLDKDV